MDDSITDVDPAIMLRIGLVVARFSRIDARVGHLLRWLLKADAGGFNVVTQNVASATQTSWVRVIVEAKFGDEVTRKTILELLNYIDEVRGQRNVFAHGLWRSGSQPSTAEVQTVRIERVDMVTVELVTRADLDEVIERMREIEKALINLALALDVTFPNWDVGVPYAIT